MAVIDSSNQPSMESRPQSFWNEPLAPFILFGLVTLAAIITIGWFASGAS